VRAVRCRPWAAFRQSAAVPFIELDQDDRSGPLGRGETLRINGSQWQEFSRVLLFAFIYEGRAELVACRCGDYDQV